MPKGEKQRTRTKPLQVRVTPEELASFRNAANESGLSLSAWVRSRLLQAAKKESR